MVSARVVVVVVDIGSSMVMIAVIVVDCGVVVRLRLAAVIGVSLVEHVTTTAASGI